MWVVEGMLGQGLAQVLRTIEIPKGAPLQMHFPLNLSQVTINERYKNNRIVIPIKDMFMVQIMQIIYL